MELNHPLTAREITYLKLYAAGYSAKLIAHALNISLRTAQKHSENINNKLMVPNSAAALTKALQLKIINLSEINVLPRYNPHA